MTERRPNAAASGSWRMRRGMKFYKNGVLTKKEYRWGLIVEDGIHTVIGWDLVVVVENWKYWENGNIMSQTDREIRSSCMEWRQMKFLQARVWRLRPITTNRVPHTHRAAQCWIDSRCETSFSECKHQTGKVYSRIGLIVALYAAALTIGSFGRAR